MEQQTLLILRFALGITFLLAAFYIIKEKSKWDKGMMPWTKHLPILRSTLSSIVIFDDILIGIFLLFGWFTPIVAVIAGLHMIGAFAVYGLNSVTYRDIAVLAISIVLVLAR